MEIKLENAQAAFNTADENTKKVLLALFPELKEVNHPITERVKTFEDACRELGSEHPFVKAWNSIYQGCEEQSKNNDIADVIAYHKLRIICAALNEGWQPEFAECEQRWFPWFSLWTDEELSEKSDKWKSERAIFPTDDYLSGYTNFVCGTSAVSPSNSGIYVGARLCLKSEALATYCGKQFISLWADFNLIRK